MLLACVDSEGATEAERLLGLELGVAFWSKAVRFTAVFLVLFIGVEILTCYLPGSDCAIVLAAEHQTSTITVSGSSAVGLPAHRQSLPDKDCDNCICCCGHALVLLQISFVPGHTVGAACREAAILYPVSRPSIIEHPPQLS